MYGSNYCIVTLTPLDFKSLPREAAVIPFPNPDTTPPVTKIYLTDTFITYSPLLIFLKTQATLFQ